MVPRAPNMQYKSSAKRPEELGAGRKESLNPQSFAPGRFLSQDVRSRCICSS